MLLLTLFIKQEKAIMRIRIILKGIYKMKKIGIITLGGYFNYGNRLQNYALQEAIKDYVLDVDTIRNNTSSVYSEKRDFLTRLKGKSPLLIYKILKNKIKTFMTRNITNKRTEVFKKFTLNYINETDFMILDNGVMESLSSRYNYYIAGSDQVWNPDYLLGTSVNFLTFVPKNKRISYAASFGVSSISPKWEDKYKEWLSDMNHISVREEDGAKIIKDLIGIDVPVLVDPTLLLTKEKWLSIAKEANNKPKGKYLLTYFLGGVPKAYKKEIKRLTKKHKLDIINLGNIREKDTYITGPSEFIDYINSCSVMYTDSFHGTVFSILLEKPFVVCDRKDTNNETNMYSRINTLLDKFSLNSRKIENIKLDEDIFNIDYSHVPSILEKERAKSMNYLKEALNIKEEN